LGATANGLLFLFTQAEHEFNIAHLGISYDGVIAEGPLALGCFLGQDVIFESLGALHFSGAGYLEPLFCTGIGFHFRHIVVLFIIFFL